jgi:hypothetical protein
MGVVLTAFGNPLIIPESELMFDEDDCPTHECFTQIITPYINQSFPKHASDIQSRGKYFWTDCQEHMTSTTCCDFNDFRNWLAELCGYPKAYNSWRNIDWAFAGAGEVEGQGYVLDEFINFSDCEGTIGTKYCQKIFKDLDAIKCLVEESDEYWVMFNRVLRGFQIAANNNGFVTLS